MQVAQVRLRLAGVTTLAIFCVMSAGALGQSASTLAGSKREQATGVAAQPAQVLTPRQACLIAKETIPLRAPVEYRQVHFVKEGLLLDIGKKNHATLAYADIKKIDFSPGAFFHSEIYIHMRDKRGSYFFQFMLTQASNDKVQALQTALESLAEAAQQGKTFVCSDDPEDYADDLTDFQQKTASWRALTTKPAVSEEVYKDRLLAEDALKNKDLNGAVKYYELGVASDPTWDQGWYNAALVYAELGNYFDAAQCMKHYVTLMPDAADARAAKDNIILWEAKAPQTVAANSVERGK